MKILITGGLGFIGQYLKKKLEEENHNVCITTSNDSRKTEKDCYYVPIQNNEHLESFLNENQFDLIYHLSAQSSVFTSFQEPFQTFDENVIGSLNLIKAIAKYSKQSKLFFISSADTYKITNEHRVLKEDDEQEAKSPYALSKLTIDQFLQMNAEKLGINATIIRQFNSIGPGQKEKFVMSSFAKQIVEMKFHNKEKILSVGNIDVYRDFIDIRDTIEAYNILKNENTKPGEVFNVCSGNAIKIRDCIDLLIKVSGLNDVIVKIDEKKYRKNDLPYVCGSNEKIKQLGWSPVIPIEKTMSDMISYWEICFGV